MLPQQYLQHSPTSYPQNTYETYWTPEANNTPVPNNNSSYQENTSSTPQYDFTNFPTNDLFQPEEIFQLDQPIRPDYNNLNTSNEIARSPPTLLDLGSGTIHSRDFKSEEFWSLQGQSLSLVNDDSNNSSCSRIYLPSSPESRDLSLNNNVSEVDRLQFLETKVDVNFKFQSTKTENEYYTNCSQIEDFRSQVGYDSFQDSNNRVFYNEEPNFSNENTNANNFSNDSIKSYRLSYNNSNFLDTRLIVSANSSEKNDIVDLDYVPYDYQNSNVNYENKILINETIEICNDIDYRLQCPPGHYSENFENMMTTN